MARLGGLCFVLALAASLLAAPAAQAQTINGSQLLGCVTVEWHVQHNQARVAFIASGATLVSLRLSEMHPRQSFSGRIGSCLIEGTMIYQAKSAISDGELILEGTVLHHGSTIPYQGPLVSW